MRTVEFKGRIDITTLLTRVSGIHGTARGQTEFAGTAVRIVVPVWLIFFCPAEVVFAAAPVSGTAGSPGLLENISRTSSPRASGRQRVLARLFEERILAQNSDAIRLAASEEELLRRYDLLRNWVLPSASHDTIRLTATFPPAHSVPVSARSVIPASPAIDLIAAASQLGRLAELSAIIDGCPASSESQQRCQLALSTLVRIQQRDFDAVRISFGELIDRHYVRVLPDLHDRWPETLVAVEAIRHPALHDTVEELLQKILHDQVRSKEFNRPDAWDQLIRSLAGQMHLARVGGNARVSEHGLNLSEWFPVSVSGADRSGSGCPGSLWQRHGHTVTAVAHHFDDYLYYRIPLQGNYRVECDLGGFKYNDGQLLVGGTWAGPAPTHNELLTGSLRELHPVQALSPRLPQIGEWMRARVEVTDGLRVTSVNGRHIHRQVLNPGHPPWLAVRLPFFAYGAVRNVSLAGNPTIPDTLNLSADPQMSGWVPYYGETVAGSPAECHWWCEVDQNGNGTIFAKREPEHAGTAKESLLRYHRPMVEDGFIAYEFFYSPEECCVHPAIGRQVFLVRPDGVRIHQITDAAFDRTGLDPQNEFPLTEEGDRAVNPTDDTERTVLKHDAWNHAELKLVGDSLTLTVNGRTMGRPIILGASVHSSGEALRESNDVMWHADRMFGLFHYAGESEARVRNVRWTGDWAKSLPPLQDQELRDKTADELDAALPRLTAVFSHDFTRDGLPLDIFNVAGAADRVLGESDNGLQMKATMDNTGSRHVAISPRCTASGDFDMTAVFEGRDCLSTKHGKLDSMLRVVVDDKFVSQHSVALAYIANPAQFLRPVAEYQLVQHRPLLIDARGQRTEEARSGALRLARRGDRLYSLLSAGDANSFRLIQVSDIDPSSIRFNGIQLVSGLNSSVAERGEINIIWKKLTVRAEQLSGPAVADRESGP